VEVAAMSAKIGDIVDQLKDIKDEVDDLNAKLVLVKAKYNEKEAELYKAADEQKTSAGKGTRGSFSIGDSVVPQVKDWDLFYKFIHKNKWWHLLERRPSVVACRELFDTKGKIPGVEKFTKRKINLRSI